MLSVNNQIIQFRKRKLEITNISMCPTMSRVGGGGGGGGLSTLYLIDQIPSYCMSEMH